MLLVISDACVLIDIECGDLTNEMFSFSYQFAVPDTLFAEELEERHAHLSQLALILAKHEGCQLLTGDKALRDAAKDLNVEVHGTIWLVKQMLVDKKITVEVSRVAFQRMRDSGSRLPWSEVEKLLTNTQ